MASFVAGLAAGSLAVRARYGTTKGQRIRPEELDEGSEKPHRGGHGQDSAVGVLQGGRQQDDHRDEEDSGQREGPPQKDESVAPRSVSVKDLAGWSSEDARIVEGTAKQGEGCVVRDRKDEQQQAGQHLGFH
jgi:hypothetical protein